MGGQPWGGSEVPGELRNAYAAYSGMDAYPVTSGGADFSASAVYGTYNMRDLIEAKWEDSGYDSPYTLVQLHDPSQDMDAAIDRWKVNDDAVRALSARMEAESDVSRAESIVDASVSWVGNTGDIAESFESERTPELAHNQARFLAGMAEVGSIHTTQARMGLALVAMPFIAEKGRFLAQAKLAGYQDRTRAILQIAATMADADKFLLEQRRLSTGARAELSKLNSVAMSEYISSQLKVDVAGEMWNFDLLDKVKSVNVVTGAPVMQRGMNDFQAFTSLAFTALGSVASIIPGLVK